MHIRRARGDDLTEIVRLLADDALGAQREQPGDLTVYTEACAEISRDDRTLLAVAVDEGGRVIGCIQATSCEGSRTPGLFAA